MANTGSQAKAIRDLLIQRLQYYDPGMDTRSNSPLYEQVINPVFEALGTDLFDTDVEQFLRDRLQQEYPDLSVADGDAIVDLLMRPDQVILESLKRETQIIRRGQSVRNSSTMRLEDAEGLAANFFVSRNTGSRTIGTVRLYYSQPTFVSVLSTVSFSTASGLRFFALRPQFFSADVLLLQKSGTMYYVDVQVIAEEAGDNYNIEVGKIAVVSGLPSVAKVTNIYPFSGGSSEETATQLLLRTSRSLTERSLNTGRGIAARLYRNFPSLRNIEVVGMGDPEMQRDIITGGGEGRLAASGICFIVGQFCLMFSQYEDRGLDGNNRVREGDEVELNYWSFLYDVEPYEANETFTIEHIIWDTRDTLTENIPSVLLFQMSGTPTVAPPIAATLPGVLPGVFAAVRQKGVIEVSNIPGGILNPDSPRGTLIIEDNEIHIGGHYDVWVRPSADTETVTNLGTGKSETALFEGDDLVTAGSSLRFKNQVHQPYVAFYSATTGSLQLGEPVEGSNGGVATIIGKTATYLLLGEFGNKDFSEGESVRGRYSGATATLDTIEKTSWSARGVTEGMLLSIVSGTHAGVYKILKVEDPFLYLDAELTSTDTNQVFRVISEVSIRIFNPKDVLLPFGDQLADDLVTVIGSKTVKTVTDLLRFSVQVGDSLEVLEGSDQGVYTIEGFDTSLGGRGPILSSRMTSTSSQLLFRVYRSGTPIQAPLVRLLPDGVALLDSSGQDTNDRIPYALPVEGRALEAFSGAGSTAYGRNGFVLVDPGQDFEPDHDVVGDPEDFAEVKTSFSDGCLDCDGYIAVVSLTEDGYFYLDSGLPSAAVTFLQDMRDWLVSIVQTFKLGDDAQSFIDAFHPVILGEPPEPTVDPIIFQAEICIPREMFDGCNNVFMALPEFDWKAEFDQGGIPDGIGTIEFSEVMDKYNSGELEGSGDPPALMQAEPGSSITILTGSNAGSYLVDKVYHYKLCTGGAIQDEGGDLTFDLDKCYDVAAVVIKGAFPVQPLSGVLEFFEEGIPTLSVPLPPTLDVTCFKNSTGAQVSPWDSFEVVLTWVFQWLNAMGFDLPDDVELDPGETFKAIWQLLFNEYIVGQPTGEQNVRLSFVEPTSFTAYGAQACVGLTYNEPRPIPATLTGGTIVIPPGGIAALDGLDVTVTIYDVLGLKTFTGTMGTDEATAATLTDLALFLQTLLDSTGDWLTITGPSLDTGEITVATVKGAAGLLMTVTFPTELGFDGTPQEVEGSIEPGDAIKQTYIPPEPTLFLAARGAAELLYTASGNLDPYQVFPGEDLNGKVPSTEMPRDVEVADDYTGATANVLRFSDASYPSPLESGVLENSDVFAIHNQRIFLDHTIFEHESALTKDRVIAVKTEFGSNVITLPPANEPDFNFLDGVEEIVNNDPYNETQVGDLVFIEEGQDAKGYRVIERSEYYLVLDAAMTESSGIVYRSDNDGVIDTGTHVMRTVNGNFTDADIGRYLTIWGCNRPNYDGSYRIIGVTDLGSETQVEIDAADFPWVEQFIHWAVVKAPTEEPDSSGTEGQTSLVGVRPIRIYNGTASEFRVVDVSNHLDRLASEVTVAHTVGLPPRVGVKSPYQFVRAGVQHISSTGMYGQGTENGLFYFDVLARSLGGDSIHNLPQDTRMEPIFGTYESEGYRLDVDDPNLVFSAEEKTTMVISPLVLPRGFEDTIANHSSMEDRLLRLNYDYAPVVSQVQGLMSSALDRILCANTLVRHFLPSYVYLDLNIQGGNSNSTIAKQLSSAIVNLSPVDPLDVSRLEKVLHRNAVFRYDHPIYVITVTHDLDRRLVGIRSQNKIGDSESIFHGSNRISFFIPGDDVSALDLSAIPIGERIYITRVNP